MASFYKNPYVEENDLVGIYNKLLQCKEVFNTSYNDQRNFVEEINSQDFMLSPKKTAPEKRVEVQVKTIEATIR